MHDHRAYAAAMARRIAPKSQERQSDIERQWTHEICRALADGELRAVHPESLRPFRHGERGSLLGAIALGVIALDVFNAWLRMHGVDIVLQPSDLKIATIAPKHTSTSEEVIEKARRLANIAATAYFDSHGRFPKKPWVAKEICADLNLTFGQSWNVDTIKRHALLGWTAAYISKTAQTAQDPTP